MGYRANFCGAHVHVCALHDDGYACVPVRTFRCCRYIVDIALVAEKPDHNVEVIELPFASYVHENECCTVAVLHGCGAV